MMSDTIGLLTESEANTKEYQPDESTSQSESGENEWSRYQFQPRNREDWMQRSSTRSFNFYAWCVLLGILTASLIANTLQFQAWFKAHQAANRCKLPLSGSEPDLQMYFGDKTAFGDASDLAALDELWQSLDTSAGFVALPKDLHLGSTDTFPWDTSKGVYILNSYHTLHCLRDIYIFVRSSEFSANRNQSFQHVVHCLDVLKSDAMCIADDTPLPYGFQVTYQEERSPKRRCRDWNKLTEYVTENSACFHRNHSDPTLHGTFAEFTFCPPNSPYRAVVESIQGKGIE